MANKEVTLEYLQYSLKDIKKHLRWLYDIVNRSVTEGSKTTDWMARQIENQDTWIEDNHRDLYDLMGTIGYMKDNLQKLVKMNQRSHIYDSPARDWAMEEASMVHPVKVPNGKQQE